VLDRPDHDRIQYEKTFFRLATCSGGFGGCYRHLLVQQPTTQGRNRKRRTRCGNGWIFQGAGHRPHGQRKALGAFTFKDATAKDIDLSAWKGRVVLLNLWATWCTPCRKEMPDIAKLQKELGSTDFEVVALSVDRKGLEASQAFLKDIGADSLKAFTDQESTSLAAIQALGLPASILIDRKGMEAARILGPAEWASPEAQAMIKALIAEK
jgi:thiol-disulfide isomerase/thioredoxin